jgi:hypothetical protein
MYRFLTSALAEGEWSASRASCFTPGERAHSTHWIGRKHKDLIKITLRRDGI